MSVRAGGVLQTLKKKHNISFQIIITFSQNYFGHPALYELYGCAHSDIVLVVIRSVSRLALPRKNTKPRQITMGVSRSFWHEFTFNSGD